MKGGKKLNMAQKKVLIKHGIRNVDEWLYVQMKTFSDGGKHLNQTSTKVHRMVVTHKTTGEVKELDMDV